MQGVVGATWRLMFASSCAPATPRVPTVPRQRLQRPSRLGATQRKSERNNRGQAPLSVLFSEIRCQQLRSWFSPHWQHESVRSIE